MFLKKKSVTTQATVVEGGIPQVGPEALTSHNFCTTALNPETTDQPYLDPRTTQEYYRQKPPGAKDHKGCNKGTWGSPGKPQTLTTEAETTAQNLFVVGSI